MQLWRKFSTSDRSAMISLNEIHYETFAIRAVKWEGGYSFHNFTDNKAFSLFLIKEETSGRYMADDT